MVHFTFTCALMLGWLTIYLMIGKTTKGYGRFLIFLAYAACAILLDTVHNVNATFSVFSAALSVCVIPGLYGWLRSVAGKKGNNFFFGLFALIPGIIAIVSSLLYLVEAGSDTTHRLIEKVVPSAVIGAELIWVIYKCSVTIKRAYTPAGQHTAVICARATIYFSLVWAGSQIFSYLVGSCTVVTVYVIPTLVAVTSLWLFTLSLFTARETLVLSNVVNLEVKEEDLANYASEMEEVMTVGSVERASTAQKTRTVIITEDEPAPVAKPTFEDTPVPEPYDDERMKALRSRFEDLMIGQQKFLTSGLTLTDVAEMLNSNKTYISRLVNSAYGISFPEYLNNLRIDFAKLYIANNRNSKQDEIAVACGFPNASSFNSTFKKVTGVTPRIWLATKKQA
ncbi:MAG: helix-turn-helix transcriptional regulator [Bacteroidales bacterium]|nr:helix-turn-helix transcriptional regulator [Bacteroidales bacterium]